MIKARLDQKSGRTEIETPEGLRYCNIPPEDAVKIAEIYEQTSHPKLDLPSGDFVCRLSHRLYTEWCLEDEENARKIPGYERKQHNKYQGEAFVDFVRGETHYSIVRKGIKPEHLNHEGYESFRNNVLEAVVRKAVFLFSIWEGFYRKLPRAEATWRLATN